MARKKSDKKMISAMVITLLGMTLLIAVLLGGPWLMNERNSKLTTNHQYEQIENTTAFLSAPLLDGVETEGSVVSGTSAGANLTAETPLWDTVSEWDSVTFTSPGSDLHLFLNVNKTPNEILKSDISGLRIKTNCSDSLEVSIYAVKSDGVDVVRSLVYSASLGNGSDEAIWNIQPIEILNIDTDLGAVVTDETYFQIVIESDNGTGLESGDTVQFQLSWRSPDNQWVWSNYNILLTVAWVGSAVCWIVAGISIWFLLVQKKIIDPKKMRW